MRNILFVLLTFLILSISCTTLKQTVDTYGVNVTSVHTISTDTFSITQMDSMSNHDNIPVYSKWVKTYLKDGSTGVAYEYGTLYDPETGILYTVKKFRNPEFYVVMKRQTSEK